MIAFSELEYGLVFLCTMTEFDFRKKDEYIYKYLGLSFEQNVRHFTDYINENLIELKSIWDEIKIKIRQLNRERRFLVHGFMSYGLPRKKITNRIKENGHLTTKKQSLEEIKGYINSIQHLNTGDNGINGEFHAFFAKTRVYKWKEFANDNNKIVYKVNDIVISNWRG